jgi:hypothetical protein
LQRRLLLCLYGLIVQEHDLRLVVLAVRISQSRDSDSVNCRTAVSLMSGHFDGGGSRLPCCVHG